jgi:hypothetical protein
MLQLSTGLVQEKAPENQRPLDVLPNGLIVVSIVVSP